MGGGRVGRGRIRGAAGQGSRVESARNQTRISPQPDSHVSGGVTRTFSWSQTDKIAGAENRLEYPATWATTPAAVVSTLTVG